MSTANKINLVSDRVERAKSLLLSQFHDKPNINALVDALVSELQELENVVNDLQTVRTLDGSYGWWLDQIGAEVDLPRGNYSDNDYKTAIKIAMARQSASATVDDILRIIHLITADTEAQLTNPSHYLLELWSYLFCVGDDQEGLASLAKLFPLNTRIRLVKHDTTSFQFNTDGAGFGSAGALDDLVYAKSGHAQDPRFVTIATQDLPPPVISSPTVISSPYIYGDNYVGGTLNLVAGTYDGDEPIVLTYQWLRNGFDIAGATGSTYVLVPDDAGTNVQCAVNAANAYGNITVYSNSLAISATIPDPNPMIDGANLFDHLTSRTTTPPTSVTNTSSIKFKSDGTLQYIQNGTVLSTLPYLVTTGAGTGNDYKVIYTVVSGDQLTGLNQNAAAPLTSDVTVSMSVTGANNILKTGEYQFTIFKASDPSISESKLIVISTEIQSEL